MSGSVIIDTGPLLTILGDGLIHQKWVREQWRRLPPPFLTCEPVLTEATFLLKREGRDADAVFELLARGIVEIGFSIRQEQADVRARMARYSNRPMSLADACLVRMSEIYSKSEIFTLDCGFRIYRRHGNRVIPLIIP